MIQIFNKSHRKQL